MTPEELQIPAQCVVRGRVAELQSTLSAGVIALEISSRNARVQALQGRWSQLREKLEKIMYERGQEMAEVPGGSTAST